MSYASAGLIAAAIVFAAFLHGDSRVGSALYEIARTLQDIAKSLKDRRP